MSKRTLIASTVMGAFALSGSAAVSAVTLNDLHKEEAKIHAAAAKSQEKINGLFFSKLWPKFFDRLIYFFPILFSIQCF